MSPANVEEMFYVQAEGLPWHGLGKALPNVATASEAIMAAGLDWEVKTEPIFKLFVGKYYEIPRQRAVTRLTDQRVYGIVSDRYTPLQNREAFKFFDKIVGEGKAIYHTAGSLDHGKKVWILAKLPGEIVVFGEDITEKFLLLTNSHDGTLAIRSCFTKVRVVCQNTLSEALSGAKNVYSIRHIGNFEERFKEAIKMMGIANSYFERNNEAYQRMAQSPIKAVDVIEFGITLFPVGPHPDDRAKLEQWQFLKANQEERRKKLAELVEVGKGTDIPGVKGSVYGLYQASVEFADYSLHKYRSNNNRLKSIWFGEAQALKQRAFDLSLALC